MRKIKESCALLMLLLLIGFRTCTPVYGMELPAQEETSGMNTKTEENDVREMGSRIPVYETLGEALIRKLSEDQGAAEGKIQELLLIRWKRPFHLAVIFTDMYIGGNRKYGLRQERARRASPFMRGVMICRKPSVSTGR